MLHVDELVIKSRFAVAKVVVPLPLKALVETEGLDFAPVAVEGLRPAGQRLGVILAEALNGLEGDLPCCGGAFLHRAN